MKKGLLKRVLSLVLVFVMMLSVVACDSSTSKTEDTKDKGSGVQKVSTGNSKVVSADVIEDEELSYVLIYNPSVYDENDKVGNLNLDTGTLGSQIEVDTDRSDSLEEEDTEFVYTPSQKEILGDWDLSSIELEDNRADVFAPDYKLRDKHEFYIVGDSLRNRDQINFECVYAGNSCYVWSDNSVDEGTLVEYGEEFDDVVYDDLVKEFGQPRFVGETGKVNILFYEINKEGLAGCFAPYDLYTENELPMVGLSGCDCNTNHAIININTLYIQQGADLRSTVAHEFQHLINYSNSFYGAKFVSTNTWINESFSGYVEDKLYPGSKESDYVVFNRSGLIRSGQSLYNFDIDYPDYGVYGSVSYFAEYLKHISGNNVFSDFSTYWRESYSDTLCVSEALKNCVSSTVQKDVDDFIDYDNRIEFDCESDEWMSKLTLSFYLSMFSKDSDIDVFKNIKHNRILFDDIDGSTIEGGGRIIVSVDEKFEIPDDSENGLIYVGLDKDFNVISDFVLR